MLCKFFSRYHFHFLSLRLFFLCYFSDDLSLNVFIKFVLNKKKVKISIATVHQEERWPLWNFGSVNNEQEGTALYLTYVINNILCDNQWVKNKNHEDEQLSGKYHIQ